MKRLSTHHMAFLAWISGALAFSGSLLWAGSKPPVRDLPEFVVESNGDKLLHVLAYVREYSTLSTYSDTVFMFREKMVDFMLPGAKRKSKTVRSWNDSLPAASPRGTGQ